MSAGDVTGSIVLNQGKRGGSNPTPALHKLHLVWIPQTIARKLIVRNHYLHSLPGGTMLCFGILFDNRLLGAVTLGAGPFLAYKLVAGAKPDDCITLTRLWLSDELPFNAESRVLGLLLRSIRKETSLKFVVAYSDPSAGHLGTIYKATGWIYTGLSSATPLYDVGDGVPRHSRSLAHELGSHSISYFASRGIKVRLVSQAAKHRYIYFLDRTWISRLAVPIRLYPKTKEDI